jgi:hypothetical protein
MSKRHSLLASAVLLASVAACTLQGAVLTPSPAQPQAGSEKARDATAAFHPQAPTPQKPPADGLIKVPSPDLNQPVPLPVLARPLPDRGPLGDPTPDISIAAALAGSVPQRTVPAPFLRLNLPDPFEHVQPVGPRGAAEEESLPPPVPPRTPK